MRILLINPNMTVAMTDPMAAIARQVAPAGTEIVALTATRGFPYIASRAEAQIAGSIACEMIAEKADGADAAIIAAFGDPGLAAARELFDFPVVGMAQAALFTAAMLGERIAIVTFSPIMVRWYTDAVAQAGLMHRFAGIRTPDAHDDTVLGDRDRLRDGLVGLCDAAVAQDGADVVIPGGAPLAGLAGDVADQVAAPLVDPIAAAALQACALAALASPQPLARRPSRPLAKDTAGLTPALARRFSRRG